MTEDSSDPGEIWRTRAGYVRPTRLTGPDREQALLQELWRISHFGWVAEATIRRTLVISAAHEIAGVSLAERLRQLVNRGWVEQRYSDLGADELEWRLTERGRDAVP